MKKLLLFSVVLLTYTLGNAQNGTQTNKSTSTSQSSFNNSKETSSVSKGNKTSTQKDNKNVVSLNKDAQREDDNSHKQLKVNKQNGNVQPLERK